MRLSNVRSEQQTNKSFHSALVGFICLACIWPLAVLLYWPYPGAEPLWVSSYEISLAQSNTLDTSALPVIIKALAWANHLLPTMIAFIFCVQMARVCSAFNVSANFTADAIKIFRQIRWILTVGLLAYWLVGIVLGMAVSGFYADYPHVSVNGHWANWPIMGGFLLLMTIYFIEGALRRGLTLQEDADATI